MSAETVTFLKILLYLLPLWLSVMAYIAAEAALWKAREVGERLRELENRSGLRDR